MNMKHLLWAACLASVVVPGALRADTVRDQILSDAEFFSTSGCQILRVGFNYPTRKVAHFPYERGDEIRIELEALSVDAEGAVESRRRESLNPPLESEALVSGIAYEGNAVPRPFLRITLRRVSTFKVSQGGDFRSIVIAFPQPQGSGTCEPVFPQSLE